jgi:hypothetical protein
MKKTFYIWLAICLAGMQTFAQVDSTKVAQEDSTKPKTTLTLAAIYSSNASYYGQTSEEKMPYVVTNATVRFPFGLYFSAMAYKLLDNSSSVISASNAAAGFEFPLSKTLSAGLGYSHTFFPANSTFLQIANANTASASLNYKSWLTTGITADYAFGKQEDIFFTFANSKNIQLGSLNKKKDIITLTPSIEIVGGTQHFYKTYITKKQKRDSLLGIPLFPSEPEQEETIKKSSSFDLLSYNLTLPLAYNRAHYMIEASYQLSVLSREVESSSGSARSFFNFSVYYQF